MIISMRSSAMLLLAGLMTLQAQEEIKPLGEVQKVQSGFKFTEGPAADKDGNVYFTDIPNERIHKWSLDGKTTIYKEKSNKSNGLMIAKTGLLFACEMGGQLVSYDLKTNAKLIVADKYDGVRFNSTNDLVFDYVGGIYFTDPEYNAPKPWPQKIRSVYYLNKQGKVSRLFEEDLPNPNGVLMSTDYKTLYVVPSSSSKVMAYPVLEPGKVGPGKVFCELAQPKGQKNSGGDGLTSDTQGNLYITSGLGIQMFSAMGKPLGIIKVPEGPANCAFGGKEMKTLFITARTSLYTVEMPIPGFRFGWE